MNLSTRIRTRTASGGLLRPALGAAVLVVVAGCSTQGGYTSGAPASAPAPATSSSAPASSPASAPASSPASAGGLTTKDSPLGTIIADGSGRTVYYFTKDTKGSGKSACSGPCLAAWPAVVAGEGTPSGTGITAELGTITRDDGTRQVTVNGMPVYLYAKDTDEEDVYGQGVGKVWYVVAADGTMITKPAS